MDFKQFFKNVNGTQDPHSPFIMANPITFLHFLPIPLIDIQDILCLLLCVLCLLKYHETRSQSFLSEARFLKSYQQMNRCFAIRENS